MRIIGSYRRLSLLSRFTMIGLTLATAIGGLVVVVLGHQIEQSILEQDAWSVGETISLALGPVISPSDFEGVSSAARSAEIGRVAADQLATGRIYDLHVWAADGTLIYSADPSMLGYRYRLGAEAARTLQGFPTFVAVALPAQGSTVSGDWRAGLQTFVPIRARDGQVLGAYEIQHYADHLAGRIGRARLTLLAGVLAGFGLLFLGLLGVVRRASSQLRWHADELSRLRAQPQGDRLGAEFASTVSHEIRAPLTSLLGYSELLLTRGARSGPQREWAEHVHQQAQRLTELVDEVLRASVIDEGAARLETEPLDVRSVVSRALSHVPNVGAAITVESHLAPDLPPALADRETLGQVLINLISNAVKYSPDGGEVRVTAAVANGALRISVADRGLGIAPEELDVIFQRFHRAHTRSHPDIGGTGLGLYIARRLVELQGGRIWAESAGRGLGTTVHVELPLAPATVTRAPAPARQTLAVGTTH